MIQFEATYESGNIVTMQLPQSWSEVTWDQYIDLINYDTGSLEKRIAILLGIEESDVMLFSTENIFYLIQAVSFTFDLEELVKHNKTPEQYKDWYIGHQAWFKLEQCKQELSKLDGKDVMNAGKEIVKIYTSEDIGNKPVTEVLGLVSFFLSRYITFINVLLN